MSVTAWGAGGGATSVGGSVGGAVGGRVGGAVGGRDGGAVAGRGGGSEVGGGGAISEGGGGGLAADRPGGGAKELATISPPLKIALKYVTFTKNYTSKTTNTMVCISGGTTLVASTNWSWSSRISGCTQTEGPIEIEIARGSILFTVEYVASLVK